ncbi:MAG: ATP-binding protein [Pseudomonadota bacterium]
MQKRIDTSANTAPRDAGPSDRALRMAVARMDAAAWLVALPGAAGTNGRVISANAVAERGDAADTAMAPPAAWGPETWDRVRDLCRDQPLMAQRTLTPADPPAAQAQQSIRADVLVRIVRHAPEDTDTVLLIVQRDAAASNAVHGDTRNAADVNPSGPASDDRTTDTATPLNIALAGARKHPTKPLRKRAEPDQQDRATLADIASRITAAQPVRAGIAPSFTSDAATADVPLEPSDDQGRILAEPGATDARPAAGDASASQRATSSATDLLAHELRTPIGAICTLSEVLLAKPHDDGQAAYLRDVRASADHALAILDRLTASARAQAPDADADADASRSRNADAVSQSVAFGPVARESTSVRALLKTATDALAPAAQRKGVRLTLGVPSSDDLVATVDPTLIRQAVDNLMTNALRHTGPGGRIDVCGRITAAGHLTIDVRDTGTGMSRADVARALGRGPAVRQVRRPTLGLALVQAVMTAHAGTLVIDSKCGCGTRVRMTLPRTEGDAAG